MIAKLVNISLVAIMADSVPTMEELVNCVRINQKIYPEIAETKY